MVSTMDDAELLRTQDVVTFPSGSCQSSSDLLRRTRTSSGGWSTFPGGSHPTHQFALFVPVATCPDTPS